MTDAHELLPWYVNGTLKPGERQAFQEHLASCAKCAAELPVLEEMRREVSQPGWAQVADHPDPEALSRVAVEGVEDPLVRRHLELCVTCAEEARWLRGEETAGVAADGGTVRATVGSAPHRRWPAWATPVTAAAAALVVLLAAGVLFLRPRQAGSLTSVGRPEFVPSVERNLGTRHEVPAPPGAAVLTLHFQTDLGPQDFPASFQVVDVKGRIILSKPDLDEQDLFNGIFYFTCSRSDCPDGDYVARLTPSGGRAPTIEYPFRIQSSR